MPLLAEGARIAGPISYLRKPLWVDATALFVGMVLAVLLLVSVHLIRSLMWSRYLSRLRVEWRCCMSIAVEDDAAPHAPHESQTSLLDATPRSDQVSDQSARASPTAGAIFPHWDLRGRIALVTGGSRGALAATLLLPLLRARALVCGVCDDPSHSLRLMLMFRGAVCSVGAGLGRSIVEELLAHGCEVLTCARDITPLTSLTSHDGRCVAVAADVATASGRDVLLRTLRRRFSFNLDILVNCVSTNLCKPSTAYTVAEYDALQATNQAAAFHLSRACFGALRHRMGCVVNVSAASGSTVDHTVSAGRREHPPARGECSTCQRAGSAAPASARGVLHGERVDIARLMRTRRARAHGRAAKLPMTG